MKRLPHILFIAMGVLIALASCNKEENNWEKYEDWRNANNAFIERKASQLNAEKTAYAYERISPNWDKGSIVLMKRLKKGQGMLNLYIQAMWMLSIKELFTMELHSIQHIHIQTA